MAKWRYNIPSNNWLEKLKPEEFEDKIGGSSFSAHAEVRTIFAALKAGKSTQDATLTVSEPLCPNCMKMAVAAGITEINFDRKGKNEAWYTKNKEDFDKLSLEIATKAGVQVNELAEKNGDVRSKKPLNKKALKNNDSPVEWSKYELIIKPYAHNPNEPIDPATQLTISERFGENHPFAATIATDVNRETILIAVPEAHSIINGVGSYQSPKYNEGHSRHQSPNDDLRTYWRKTGHNYRITNPILSRAD